MMNKHTGPIAQLGERVVRNDEVEGSIPFRSTISLDFGIAQAGLLWYKSHPLKSAGHHSRRLRLLS